MNRHVRIVLNVLMLGSLVTPAIAFADATLPGLIHDLRNAPDPEDRKRAAADIEDLGPAAAEAVPALIEALTEDRWPKVRQAAAGALGDLGEAAKVANPVLYEAMKDPDGHVRVAARNALFRLDQENKTEVVRLEDEFDAAPPARGASDKLHEDVRGMPELLVQEVPIAAELTIYPDFAIVTAPESTSPSGWAQFTYENGVIGGPKDGRVSCEKTFQFAKVDLSLVPKMVKEALKRAGGDAEVSLVTLSHGVFCKKPGWAVGLENGANASRIEFKTNGKVSKVWP